MKRSQPPQPLPFAIHAAIASLVGLGLRLFLVLKFPADAGDSGIYRELAQNWLHERVYGIFYATGLKPSDIRVPGYPAFLALADILLRRGQGAVVLAQAFLDLGTCFLVAWLASRLAPPALRSRIALAALWLAATCPLVANYAAVTLAEVLATFLTAAALILLVGACIALEGDKGALAERFPWNTWLAAGLVVGLATLVRPESPLLLAALALVLAVRWRRRADWGKLARVGVLTAAGLVLPLAPWAARNWVRFHQVQFLAPRFAASPDEYTPRGLYAWTATWLVRFRDVYLVPWNIGSDRVEIGDIPAAAFDSPAERARVAALLDQYNATVLTTPRVTPDVDLGFATLARERTARHPLRTYAFVPLGRALTLWFTPRTELLPVSGHLWPIGQEWREDPLGFSVTVFLGALNFFYVGLAVAGLWRAHRQRDTLPAGVRTGVMLLVTFMVVRTAFLTQVETPEPRYVLECFPALLALGALVWLPRASDAPGYDVVITARPEVRGES